LNEYACRAEKKVWYGGVKEHGPWHWPLVLALAGFGADIGTVENAFGEEALQLQTKIPRRFLHFLEKLSVLRHDSNLFFSCRETGLVCCWTKYVGLDALLALRSKQV
jgi:hypothetical protein